MKKTNIFYLFLLLCFALNPHLGMAQGIISTPADELITVDPSGNSNADAPNVGISVGNPTANLDVECAASASGISNLRFRNLMTSNDTMVLVHDANGFVHSRPYNSGGGSGLFWALLGNAGTNPATHFVGTQDATRLHFGTVNAQRMFLTTTGDFSVGMSNTPAGRLNLTVGAGNNITAASSVNTLTGSGNNVNGWACFASGQTNTIGMTNGGVVAKSVTMGWNNNSQNHNQYLIGAANSATQEYSGVYGVGQNVTQRGAWYLGGNSGTTLTNNLGNTFAIGWGNRHTGLFDRNGLTLGTATGNTTNANDNATARLDVFAPAFNNFPSGVRFRQLPLRDGTILVIDQNDYVYDSGIHIEELLAMIGGAQPNEEETIDQLQKEVEDLKKQVKELMALTQSLKANPASSTAIGASLDIHPNPTGGEITVNYYIPQDAQDAQLIITDSAGKEVRQLNIDCAGDCSSNIRLPAFLNSGNYFCSLFINHTLVKSQTISYSK